MRVVVVGAGFAGTIAARIARSQGHDVTLVDKGRHPRFAIGESSTPLAAIVLERLAARYRLADLHQLATYGRWRTHLGDLRCGLKRGFTFYQHQRGQPFRGDATNTRRLLVAASPDDAAADTHWMREDVDAFLVRRARAEGVRYCDDTDLAAVEADEDGLCLTATRRGQTLTFPSDFVIDASGAAGVVARSLGETFERSVDGLHTGLVYGHFEGLTTLASTLSRDTATPVGPFPDERAAVHHLVDEGWMYELRFNTGVVSAGFVLDHDRHVEPRRQRTTPLADRDPSETFYGLLQRYPTLARQFERAQPTRPIATIPTLQRRLTQAAGHRWVALPHTYMFWSPLFSTGIAWSLLGVERVGLMLEGKVKDDELARRLQRYNALLTVEGDYLRQLIEGAYSCRHDFDRFDAFAQVYFVAASYCEMVQRLCGPPNELESEWAWFGFLGATDPALRKMVGAARQLIQAGTGSSRLEAVKHLLSSRNVAGLADPLRRRLYPVDLTSTITAAEVLGLSRDEVRARLPRLRSGP